MNPVLALIQRTRLPATPEKDVQAAIAATLEAAGIAFEREVRLAPGDIIDFLVEQEAPAPRLGIEVKIKGARRQILRQLERYAACDRIDELALVSSVAMGLPAALAGKRLHVVSLGRAWL